MSESSPEPVADERDAAPLPPAPDAVSIDLSAAEGLPRAAQRRGWAASLLAAFTGHALLLLALSWSPGFGLVGAGGTELEAIDIEIVSSKVLESRFAGAQTAAAPPDPVDYAAQGALPAEARAAAADLKPSPADPETQPAGPMPDLVMPDAKEEKAPAEPTDLALRIAESRPDQPDEQEPETEPKHQEQTQPEAADPSKASEASEAAEEGGAAARGIDGVEASGRQAAAASPGAANAYAKSVIETLAKRKPPASAGVRGTVRIGFTVARTGEVSEARVLSSSGRRVLDEAALSAVRNAKFPAPPAALANAQLSYEVPYIFR
ncbi:MAG: TonB family protein [Hyphomicrobiaceae bacterium]|nr:TonB family protein [Hyphomicrobiaceae bacterium]